MKEELLKQILPIVEKTKDGLLKGIEVLEKECPEMVRELLNWKLAENILIVIGTSICIVGLIFLAKWTIKNFQEDGEPNPVGVIGIISSGVFFIIVVIGIIESISAILSIVKIIFAPRIFLLDYIAGILK